MRRIPIEEMGQFQADVGYVYPVSVEHNNGFRTRPFARLTDIDVKDAVLHHLSEEFGCSLERVEREWTHGPDALYVCTTNNNNTNKSSLVGFVAVDRQRFRPYVSHLYVIEEHRGKGVASQLLELAETSALEMGFSEVRLWCKFPLVGFYSKRGYEEYQMDDEMVACSEEEDDGTGNSSIVHLRKRLGDGGSAAPRACQDSLFGFWSH